MMKFIYRLTMARSKKMIVQTYGKDFYIQFRNRSDSLFKSVLKETPDIGESIFSFNYAYAPSYVAWYKTMMELGLNQKQADELMWHMNEKMLRQENGSLHPFDWEIEYRDINKNEFMIKIKKYIKITVFQKRPYKKFDARGILPGICAVDYIVAYYMKNGFHCTKTLGYGDDCCDCRYALNGSCPLKPGNGQK